MDELELEVKGGVEMEQQLGLVDQLGRFGLSEGDVALFLAWGVRTLLCFVSNGVCRVFYPIYFGKFEHGAEVFSHVDKMGFGFAKGVHDGSVQMGHEELEPR